MVSLIMARWAGVHCRYQLEPRGIAYFGACTGDMDLTRFDGLPQRIQNAAFKFRQFIQKQDAVVRQRDLSRPWYGATADHGRQ